MNINSLLALLSFASFNAQNTYPSAKDFSQVWKPAQEGATKVIRIILEEPEVTKQVSSHGLVACSKALVGKMVAHIAKYDSVYFPLAVLTVTTSILAIGEYYKHKQSNEQKLSDKLIHSKEGKKYLKLIKRIKKALECRISSIVQYRTKLIDINSKLRKDMIYHSEENYQIGLIRWEQEIIEKNITMIAAINACLAELSAVLDVEIFASSRTKAEILKAFAVYNCCDYNSLNDYESIKEDLKNNNPRLEEAVNKLEQNLEQKREKFSAVCADVQKHFSSLPWSYGNIDWTKFYKTL